jgi:hypothetical protein
MANDQKIRIARDTPTPFLFFTLPDELHLNIAHCLPKPDLCELSLVSKHVESITQKALYRVPCIPHLDQPPSRIAMFALTCVRRPQLARKVLTLNSKPHIETIPVDKMLILPRNDAVAAPLQHLTIPMKGSKIVGHLLSHVHNLQQLI